MAEPCECPDKSKELEETVDIKHAVMSDRQHELHAAHNKQERRVRPPSFMSIAMVKPQ